MSDISFLLQHMVNEQNDDSNYVDFPPSLLYIFLILLIITLIIADYFFYKGYVTCGIYGIIANVIMLILIGLYIWAIKEIRKTRKNKKHPA